MTKSAALAAAVLAWAMPADSTAHQLDEYLQATRVSLSRNQVSLEIDLTPGATIASEVIARLDRDSDNSISPFEAAAYGQLVLRDLVLKLDERPIVMSLAHVEIAPIDALRSGTGAIQLRMVGDLAAHIGGHHQVYFRNNHQPHRSVYLVNALVPEDGGVSVTGQARIANQQEVRIDYAVAPEWPVPILWLVVRHCRAADALRALALDMADGNGIMLRSSSGPGRCMTGRTPRSTPWSPPLSIPRTSRRQWRLMKSEGTLWWSRAVATSGILTALISPILGAAADRAGRAQAVPRNHYDSVYYGDSRACVRSPEPGERSSDRTGTLRHRGHLFRDRIRVLQRVSCANCVARTHRPRVRIRMGGRLRRRPRMYGDRAVGFVQPESPWFGISTEDGFNVRATNLLVAVWFAALRDSSFLFVPQSRAGKVRLDLRGSIRELGPPFGMSPDIARSSSS